MASQHLGLNSEINHLCSAFQPVKSLIIISTISPLLISSDVSNICQSFHVRNLMISRPFCAHFEFQVIWHPKSWGNPFSSNHSTVQHKNHLTGCLVQVMEQNPHFQGAVWIFGAGWWGSERRWYKKRSAKKKMPNSWTSWKETWVIVQYSSHSCVLETPSCNRKILWSRSKKFEASHPSMDHHGSWRSDRQAKGSLPKTPEVKLPFWATLRSTVRAHDGSGAGAAENEWKNH